MLGHLTAHQQRPIGVAVVDGAQRCVALLASSVLCVTRILSERPLSTPHTHPDGKLAGRVETVEAQANNHCHGVTFTRARPTVKRLVKNDAWMVVMCLRVISVAVSEGRVLHGDALLLVVELVLAVAQHQAGLAHRACRPSVSGETRTVADASRCTQVRPQRSATSERSFSVPALLFARAFFGGTPRAKPSQRYLRPAAPPCTASPP